MNEEYATEGTSPLEQAAATHQAEEAPKRTRGRRKHPEGAKGPEDAIAREGAHAGGHAAEGGERHWGERVPRANVITDPDGEVKFHFDYDRHKAAIEFPGGKPSDAVRQKLKDEGFGWKPEMGAWEIPIRYDQRVQDRQHAIDTFNEVADMVRAEKGQPARAAGAARG